VIRNLAAIVAVGSLLAVPQSSHRPTHLIPPTSVVERSRAIPAETSRSMLRPMLTTVALPVPANPPPADLTDPPVAWPNTAPAVASGKLPRSGLPAVPARAVVARPATVATGETSPEPTAQQWHALAVCESGDVVGQRANPRYRGWLQIGFVEWRTYGGVALTGVTDPADATGAQQLVVAERIYAARGSEPWSCGRWLR
jgi:hypothetical protein